MVIQNGSWILVGSVIIICSLCISWAVNHKEQFSNGFFKAYNSKHIPPDTQKSDLQTDLDKFNQLIQSISYNKKIPTEFIIDYNVLYMYKNDLRKTLEDSLNIALSESGDHWKDVSIKVSGENPIVAYKAVNEKDIFYKYSVNIFSKTRYFATQLEVIVVAENMQMYLSPDGKYQSMIRFPPSSFKVASIKMIDTIVQDELNALPQIDDYFMTIDNNLYVMAPSLKINNKQ